MKENTNKAIAVNSIIIYSKTAINTILMLFTTRYALMTLGVSDFGLFSVLGSIIVFMGVFNTIMLSTCNRFIAVAIGKNDVIEANKVFNVNLSIFILCVLVFLFIGFPIGFWYINNYINYDGPSPNVVMVFCLTIVGTCFSTLATPYNGLLIAKEQFFLFSIVDVLAHVVRFVIVILMLYFFSNKLLTYTILQVVTTSAPFFVYSYYCHKTFPEIVKLNLSWDRKLYKEVFSFSGWVSYGAFACIARQQGAALLVNTFFNTTMNTALGLANSINAYILTFSNSLTQPMVPQITKSYTAGNYERTNELLIMATKYTFLLMLLLSSIFFVGAEWVINLWLGQVPLYVVSFTILLIIDNLVLSLNSGLSVVLFASGKIALYQILINTLRLLSIVAAYFLLKMGTEPYYLFYAYIFFNLIIVICTQWCLKRTLNYDISIIIRKSYIPSFTSLVLFIPVVFISNELNPLWRIVISFTYLLCIEYLVGLSGRERNALNNQVVKILRRK